MRVPGEGADPPRRDEDVEHQRRGSSGDSCSRMVAVDGLCQLLSSRENNAELKATGICVNATQATVG